MSSVFIMLQCAMELVDIRARAKQEQAEESHAWSSQPAIL